MLSYRSTWADIIIISVLTYVTAHPLLTLIVFYGTLIGSIIFSRLIKMWDNKLYISELKKECYLKRKNL